MLKKHGDWMDLGAADEQKAKDGTVEAWGRSKSNPIGGWYGPRRAHARSEGQRDARAR